MNHAHIHWLLFIGGFAAGALVAIITLHIALKSQYEKPKQKK